MKRVAVIGAQYGDEGKGKIVDYLADSYQTVVRFNGGPNAGHTVQVGETAYKVHQIPAGAFRSRHRPSTLVLANGMVIDQDKLVDEIKYVRESTGRMPDLKISNRAHLLTDEHRRRDAEQEHKRGQQKIGTTKSGNGPCYSDKAGRFGERMADSAVPELREYITDTSRFLNSGDCGNTLFAGAHGTMLDIDHGTYPYCTSSNCTVGGVMTGAGIPPGRINRVLGVAKVYLTRYPGPLPTEILDEDVATTLQDRGCEYGTTTGRPRRVGWLDLPALRYAHRLNGFDRLALTKLDVLSELDSVKICIRYKNTDTIPAAAEEYYLVEPVYREYPTPWGDIRNVRTYDDLPPEARYLVGMIEEYTGVEVGILSVGPKRDQTIIRAASMGMFSC